jgi:arginyl-tRNA synthetase
MSLIRKMLMLPELIENMALSLEPHHLPHYAMELATAFHWFYQQCRVVSNEPEAVNITKARLKLVEATRITLSHTLNLMGVAAPEKM